MKIYIVLRVIPYEGSDIVAVYSSMENAEKAVAHLEKMDDPYYDFTVEEQLVLTRFKPKVKPDGSRDP